MCLNRNTDRLVGRLSLPSVSIGDLHEIVILAIMRRKSRPIRCNERQIANIAADDAAGDRRNSLLSVIVNAYRVDRNAMAINVKRIDKEWGGSAMRGYDFGAT